MVKDRVFCTERNSGDFRFDVEVCSVFDDMLVRSIPFYNEIQDLILKFSRVYSKEDSNIYDLGCSTGTTMLNILKYKEIKNIKMIGIDNCRHMLDSARKKIEKSYSGSNFELRMTDLNFSPGISNASVVIAVLTLHFLKPESRGALLNDIYKGLLKKGCLIIVEKIRSDVGEMDELFTDIYQGFKKNNGYSDQEIYNKRKSLENVLLPYSLEDNIGLIKNNGFKKLDIFFKWNNFAGFIGIKD